MSAKYSFGNYNQVRFYRANKMIRKTSTGFLLLLTLLNLSTSDIRAGEITVIVKDTNHDPVANIAVWVTPKQLSGKTLKNPVTISQKNKAFIPYFSIVQAQQPIVFSNNDDISHHVFSASREKSFSFRLKKGESNRNIAFSNNVAISMGCNVHDWMSAHLLVVDTPYYGHSNEEGRVTLSIEELGEASLEIWHPQINDAVETLKRSITIEQQSATITFQLTKPLDQIPEQKSGDDFDFLDDY